MYTAAASVVRRTAFKLWHMLQRADRGSRSRATYRTLGVSRSQWYKVPSVRKRTIGCCTTVQLASSSKMAWAFGLLAKGRPAQVTFSQSTTHWGSACWVLLPHQTLACLQRQRRCAVLHEPMEETKNQKGLMSEQILHAAHGKQGNHEKLAAPGILGCSTSFFFLRLWADHNKLHVRLGIHDLIGGVGRRF